MRGSLRLESSSFHGVRPHFVPGRLHDCFLIPVSDAADAHGRCPIQPAQFRFLHSFLFDFGCRGQLMHNCFTFPIPSQLCLVGATSGFIEHRVGQVVIEIFVSGFINVVITFSFWCVLQSGQFRCQHGFLLFICDPLGFTTTVSDQCNCLAFPFPLRMTFGLVEHAQTEIGIFELFMVSGFISYLILMTMSPFSFLCLATDARSAFQPGQFRFLHCSMWLVGPPAVSN